MLTGNGQGEGDIMNSRLVRLSKSAVTDAYYSWLCDLISANQHSNKTYWLLANDLHHHEFNWSVPNDDNRAFEAKNLREQFCEENGIVYIYTDFPPGVSMLELIIGLAYRCESIMEDQLDGMKMRDWFWKIMVNVGLDEYADDVYYEMRGQVIVGEILEKIVNRTYHKDGKGGLFPLKHPKKDQRKVELWYQMNEYLVENYYSECKIV
jgi:hypothetical protein